MGCLGVLLRVTKYVGALSCTPEYKECNNDLRFLYLVLVDMGVTDIQAGLSVELVSILHLTYQLIYYI